jgi:hypothetical protein
MLKILEGKLIILKKLKEAKRESKRFFPAISSR